MAGVAKGADDAPWMLEASVMKLAQQLVQKQLSRWPADQRSVEADDMLLSGQVFTPLLLACEFNGADNAWLQSSCAAKLRTNQVPGEGPNHPDYRVHFMLMVARDEKFVLRWWEMLTERAHAHALTQATAGVGVDPPSAERTYLSRLLFWDDVRRQLRRARHALIIDLVEAAEQPWEVLLLARCVGGGG
eukprot:COSAG01_NODE_5106_length_4477_cov_19.011192_2_plen_189_part_00